ncbi:MAG: hypothetical protein NC223_10570, partial [Butyrivibrio sp.]|nr:hypothetical protein [Butyrivibrio sp.]
MKRKIIALLTALSMAAQFCAYAPVSTIAAENQSGVCICDNHDGWTRWSNNVSLPTDEGSYYLTENVSLKDTYTLPSDVRICLNGHTIYGHDGSAISIPEDTTLDLCDCTGEGHIESDSADGVIAIQNNGTLNMYGGSICNNKSGSGVYNRGVFNMYGGKIHNNEAPQKGGGVRNAGDFTMYGGEISENKQTGDYEGCGGGGVFVDGKENKNASFVMRDGTISDNSIVAAYYKDDVEPAISAGGGGGVFVFGGSFEMSGGTITRNECTGGTGTVYTMGGGIFVNGSGAEVTLSGGTVSHNKANYAGAVGANNGSVTLSGVNLSNNSAVRDDYLGGGGALHITSGATVIMTDGIISENNSTSYGGAIRLEANGKFVMNGGTVSENKAEEEGGAVYLHSGDMEINGGTISGNEARTTGGGISIFKGSLLFSDGTISQNKSLTMYGGGVYVSGSGNGKFIMSGGSITNNTASTHGGGIYLSSTGAQRSTFEMSGGSITGNSTQTAGAGIFQYGSMVVSGEPVIQNNSLTSGALDNLGCYNTVTIGSDGLSGNAKIGITTYKNRIPVKDSPANITGANASDYSEFFVSDKEIYYITKDADNVIQLTVDAPPHTHIWGDWLITDEPSLTSGGSAERVCSKDNNHKETKTLPALNDTSVWSLGERVEPSEGSEGLQTYTSEYGSVVVVLPALPHTHNWGDWRITDEPSLTGDGSAERLCSKSNDHKETKALPALNDTSVWSLGERVEPAEDSEGSQTYTSEYGSVVIVLPALPHTHNWGDWRITDEPSLTGGGSAERVCSKDNDHKETKTLPALNDTSVWSL